MCASDGTVDGFVTGVRFYKGAGNVGTHAGRLWSNTGILLATVTFTNETTSGWQTALFSQPVAISANTTYVAGYSAPSGHYSGDTGSLATAYDLAPLAAPWRTARTGRTASTTRRSVPSRR